MYKLTYCLVLFLTLSDCKSIEKKRSFYNEEIVDIAQILAKHVLEQEERPIFFKVKNPVSPFIGREAEIEELKWLLIDKKMTVISGEKGVGKTELARKIAMNLKHDNESSILFIDASTDKSIIDSFKDAALFVGIRLDNQNALSIIKKVIEYFQGRKTLLILDNAAKDNIIVDTIPNFISNPRFIRIIITTRSEEWKESYKKIKLQPFTSQDYRLYIKGSLHRKLPSLYIDNGQVERIVNLVGSIPLDLNIVVKKIEEDIHIFPEKGIDDFIEKLERGGVPEVSVRPPNGDEIEDFLRERIKSEAKGVWTGTVGNVTTGWNIAKDYIVDKANVVYYSGLNPAKDFVVDKANVAYYSGIKVAVDTVRDTAVDVGKRLQNLFSSNPSD